jgi:RNA polymerase sigma factor (sigma-70 family)
MASLEVSPVADNLTQSFIRWIQTGDKNEGDQFFRNIQPMLFRYARKLAQCDDEAMELVSETFVRMVEHRGSYSPHVKVTTWACAILMHYFIQGRRHLAVELKHRSSVARGSCTAGPSSLDHAARCELHEQLRRWMDSFPPELRDLIDLKIVENLSYREIGEILHTKPKTAATRFRRIVMELRQMIIAAGL